MDGNCFNLFMLVLIYNKYSLVMIISIVFFNNSIIHCGKRTGKCVGTMLFPCGRDIQTLDKVEECQLFTSEMHPSVAWCIQIAFNIWEERGRIRCKVSRSRRLSETAGLKWPMDCWGSVKFGQQKIWLRSIRKIKIG